MSNINAATYTGLIVGAIAILFSIGMFFFPEKITLLEDRNLQYFFAVLCFFYGGFRVYRSVKDIKS